MKCAFLFFVAACAFCFVSVANAQVQTGTPPFGTFDGGPDVIDLGNLNAQLVIPVLNKQGRGMPFVFAITYDSSVWAPATSGSTKVWQSPFQFKGFGWNTTEANIGAAGPQKVSVVQTPEFCDNGLQEFVVSTDYSNWVYTDGFNIAHAMGGANSDVTVDQCTNTTTTDPGFGVASDGSGYQISTYGNTVTQLLGPDGSSITPNTGAGSIEDRNGNLISIAGNGVVTDTLGQAVITPGGTSSGRTFTYVAPSGVNASYTEKFTSYTVKTNFQCGGINEFGPTSQNLVSEIDLPDDNPNGVRDRYTFTYEATPNFPGDVTGRIASVNLPTGGTITYSYSGGTGANNSGIVCADGSTATLTRATPDGTWTYAHTESGGIWGTTVTDPQGNQTVYNFIGIYQTERKVYQGSSSGTLLEDDATCYNGNTTNCNSDQVLLPISQRAVTETVGSKQCQHIYKYSNNFLTEQDDFDYGNGAPGPLFRKELITYASLGNNILGAPSQIQIQDGSGTVVSQTNITYDGASPAPTNGTPQHVSITGSRGNPTNIAFFVAGSTTLSETLTYFDTGRVDVATDVNGAATTYNYSDATSTCGNAFPTSVSEPLGLSRSMTWNCTGGVQASATDENGHAVSTTWNDQDFWRPANSTDQLGNQATFSYPSPTTVESSLRFNGTTSIVDILKTLDDLGRVQTTQQRETPSSGNFDSLETDYDALGRPSRGTVPYVGAASGTNGSAPATTQTYDALNRPLVATDGGGGTVTKSYTGNDVMIAIGPAPAGENPKQRQLEYNSIGQLTSVCEITAGTASAPAGTCGQTNTKTGYWTQYTYDVLGDLRMVTQNAQAQMSSQQTRNYTYDGLGRMTSEQNPETGTTTISYVYDADGTCGTSDGDLVKKTDVAGNVTCFAYDQLHRVTSITYPSGPNAGNTPGKFFVYDSATVNSVAMVNAESHLAEAYTATCKTCSKITDEGFSYTARAEISDEYESTPHSGGYYHAAATYWANGVLDALTGAGTYSNSYNVDGEGRVFSAKGTSTTHLASTTYNAASQPTVVKFGSLDSDTFTYDPNTFRMTQYKYTVGATPQSVIGNLTWNANGTLQSLGISDPFNAANTQNCAYSYDDLARLASGNCGSSIWAQTFSYDAFGNITKSGSMQFQPGYNYQTNQMASGASYDAMGDVVSDGLHSYVWNSDTRPTTIDTVTVTYDAFGRMVEQTSAGVSTEMEYSPTGFVMALLKGQSEVKLFMPFPGGTEQVWQTGGGASPYYRHSDWLGGSRFASTQSRTMYNDLAYAPFGETYAQAGSTGVGNISFAGNDENTVANLYDAQFREYGIQGRWPSPDPAGFSMANPANPQSWNRYAYVQNNPLGLVDPRGLGLFSCDVLLKVDSYTSGPESSQIVSVICSGVGGGGRPEPVGAGGDSGGGGPAGLNIGHLIGQTLVALQNPNCAALFGGFQNAVDAISNSTYNLYSPGDTNPYPSRISPSGWNNMVSGFSTHPTRYGDTFSYSSQPGGITFFNGVFQGLNSGFASPFTDNVSQQTGFLHELEHASTAYYDRTYSSTIDGDYTGDALKLNSACQPPQFETTSPPIGTTLIP